MDDGSSSAVPAAAASVALLPAPAHVSVSRSSAEPRPLTTAGIEASMRSRGAPVISLRPVVRFSTARTAGWSAAASAVGCGAARAMGCGAKGLTTGARRPGCAGVAHILQQSGAIRSGLPAIIARPAISCSWSCGGHGSSEVRSSSLLATPTPRSAGIRKGSGGGFRESGGMGTLTAEHRVQNHAEPVNGFGRAAASTSTLRAAAEGTVGARGANGCTKGHWAAAKPAAAGASAAVADVALLIR